MTVPRRVLHAASVLGTATVIVILWSLWSAPSISAWLDFLKWWKPGA